MRRPRLISVVALVVVVLGGLPLSALAQGPFADPAFATTWARTDLPVSTGEASRTYYWGPCTSTPGGVIEQLTGAPGNRRVVQYFDKSRMEINDPNGDRDAPWFVTNGLLASELITGRMQVGYAAFEARAPSDQPVAGDPGDMTAPSYRALGRVLNRPPRADGVITETIDHAGNVGNNPGLISHNVTSSDLIAGTNHRLASVFKDFLISQGPISENGQLVIAPLSEPPFFVTGLPISEAYWARAAIGGVVRDVLVQVFERRVLTYVPTNPANFRVEMGNIGLHYRAWRYGTSLDYFGALVGNRWVYANSGSGIDLTYQVTDLDNTFKPGLALLRVAVINAAAPTASSFEFWEERDGQLFFHGSRQPGGEIVRYEPPYALYQYCLEVGQSWSVVTTKTEGPGVPPKRVEFLFFVDAVEMVTTANGATYPAFRIRNIDNDTADGSLKELVLWFSPYVGMVKRQILEFSLELEGAALK